MINNKIGVTVLFTNGAKTFINDNQNYHQIEALQHLCRKIEKLQNEILNNGVNDGYSLVLNSHVKNAAHKLVEYAQ